MLAEAVLRSPLSKWATHAIRVACIVGALGVAFVAQQGLAARPANLEQSLQLYGLAIVLLGVGVWRQRPLEAPQAVSTTGVAKLSLVETVLRACLGVLGIALISAASYDFYRLVLGPYKVFTFENTMTLYGLGIVAFALAFSFVDGAQMGLARRLLLPITRMAKWVAEHKLECSAVLFVMALATFMRVYRLDEYPPGLGGDEGLTGVESLKVMDNPAYRPIYNALSYYVIAVTFKLGGESVLLARLTTIAVGIATVLFLYLLVRLVMGPRFAFLAALLLATSRWHVNMSRSLLDLAYVPLFEIAALYFLWRGMKSERLLSFFWSALALTLGLYCYVAFRAVPIIVIAFLVSKLVMDRKSLLRNWKGLLLFGTSLLVLSAPYWTILLTSSQTATGRPLGVMIFNNKAHLGVVGKGDVEILLENAKKVYLQFNYVGDPNGMGNIPTMPMLDPWSGPLFVLGLGLATVYWWREQNFLWGFAFWLTTFVGDVLTIDQPHSGRIIGVVPILAVLGVYALYSVWKVLVAAAGGRYEWPLYAVVAAPAVLAAYLNYDVFFNRQIVDRAVYVGWAPPITEAGHQAAAMGRGTKVYLFANFYSSHPPYQFAGKRSDSRDSFAVAGSVPPPAIGTSGAGYVASGGYEPWLTVPRAYYPDGKYQEVPDRFGGLLAASYYISKDKVEERYGLSGRYFANAMWEGEPTLVRRDPVLDFDWSREQPVPGDFSVEWIGALVAPKAGVYTIGMRTGDLAEIAIDGEVVVNEPGGQGLRETKAKVDLAEGVHKLVVKYATAKGQDDGETAPHRIEVTWESQVAGVRRQTIPSNALLATTAAYGLTGSYYNGPGEGAALIRRRVDPLLWFRWRNDPLPVPPRSFRVVWVGSLQIDKAGRYVFEAVTDGKVTLRIDERTRQLGTAVDLQAGLHPVEIEYVATRADGWLQLGWTPPGQKKELVPTTAFRPEKAARMESPGPQSTTVVVGNPPVEKGEAKPSGPNPSQPAAGPLRYTSPEIWGEKGNGPGQLNAPWGGVVDGEGNIYIADTGNGRIVKLDRDWNLLVTWVITRSRDGRAGEPTDMAILSDTLVVLEKQEGRLLQFTRDGSVIGQLGTAAFPGAGGLGTDGRGNLYVADTLGNRVVKLSPEGAALMTVGGPGSNNPGLKGPTDVAIGGDGSMYVIDAGLHAILLLDAEGNQVRRWAFSDSNTDDAPQIAVDRDGLVYVSDPRHGRVTVYTADGQGKLDIGPFSQPPVTFNRPAGVWMDKEGQIYVADRLNNRIQRFRRD